MTRYHSPREVAHAIQNAAPIKLGLLFYNEHSPDTTPVWLLPDPDETGVLLTPLSGCCQFRNASTGQRT
jgi:hypothetical protein